MSIVEGYCETDTLGRHLQSVITPLTDDFIHMINLNTSLIMLYFNMKTVSYK